MPGYLSQWSVSCQYFDRIERIPRFSAASPTSRENGERFDGVRSLAAIATGSVAASHLVACRSDLISSAAPTPLPAPTAAACCRNTPYRSSRFRCARTRRLDARHREGLGTGLVRVEFQLPAVRLRAPCGGCPARDRRPFLFDPRTTQRSARADRRGLRLAGRRPVVGESIVSKSNRLPATRAPSCGRNPATRRASSCRYR